jgi:hypothetical protein
LWTGSLRLKTGRVVGFCESCREPESCLKRGEFIDVIRNCKLLNNDWARFSAYLLKGAERKTSEELIKIDNSSCEKFKYLGTTLKNQNSIQEEIKSKLKSGNACYHSVQNLLSSCFLSKNIKMKMHRTIILPVVL